MVQGVHRVNGTQSITNFRLNRHDFIFIFLDDMNFLSSYKIMNCQRAIVKFKSSSTICLAGMNKIILSLFSRVRRLI